MGNKYCYIKSIVLLNLKLHCDSSALHYVLHCDSSALHIVILQPYTMYFSEIHVTTHHHKCGGLIMQLPYELDFINNRCEF